METNRKTYEDDIKNNPGVVRWSEHLLKDNLEFTSRLKTALAEINARVRNKNGSV